MWFWRPIPDCFVAAERGVRGVDVIAVRPDAARLDVAARTVGGVAIIVANNVDEKVFGAYISEDTDTVIPLLSGSQADGAQLRAGPSDEAHPARRVTERVHGLRDE